MAHMAQSDTGTGYRLHNTVNEICDIKQKQSQHYWEKEQLDKYVFAVSP